jgi:hypothetical protein
VRLRSEARAGKKRKNLDITSFIQMDYEHHPKPSFLNFIIEKAAGKK